VSARTVLRRTFPDRFQALPKAEGIEATLVGADVPDWAITILSSDLEKAASLLTQLDSKEGE